MRILGSDLAGSHLNHVSVALVALHICIDVHVNVVAVAKILELGVGKPKESIEPRRELRVWRVCHPAMLHARC